jgi:hypothetical protein
LLAALCVANNTPIPIAPELTYTPWNVIVPKLVNKE